MHYLRCPNRIRIPGNSYLWINPEKNKTDNWLKRTRVQFPFGINQYGLIKKIAQKEISVNGNQKMAHKEYPEQNGLKFSKKAVYILEDDISEEKAIMMSLLVKPDGGEIQDYCVVTSSYGRPSEQVQSLLNKAVYYYIDPDKKRTDNWLSALRVQFPSATTKYDSIRSIPKSMRNCNQKFSLKEYSEEIGLGFSDKEDVFKLQSYGKQELKNWEMSKKIIVYQNPSQFHAFLEDALQHRIPAPKMYFWKMNHIISDYIKNAFNIESHNYNRVLRADEVEKIIKNHGDEKIEDLRGQTRIQKEDFRYIPYILSTPDTIEMTGYFENKPVLRFTKGVHSLSAVILKKRSLATAIDEQASIDTSETAGGTALFNSINENSKNNNQKMSQGILRRNRSLFFR